jgi:hypothetical protein
MLNASLVSLPDKSHLDNYYSSNSGFYIVRIRNTDMPDLDAIVDGLRAMDYELQSRRSGNEEIFFCEGITVAPLRISHTKKGPELSLPYYASVTDWELLRDWLLNFFNFNSGIAIAENELVDDIETFFSEGMISRQLQLYSARLQESMRSDEEILHAGVYRNFFAGKKIYERLRELQESEQLSMLQDMILKSQYTNLHSTESVIEVFNEELNSTYTVIDNSNDIILQPADLIRIVPADEEIFSISYSTIDKLLRHGWHYLDEKQVFIPKMKPEDWKGFCDQAREFSINTELYSRYLEDKEQE